MRHFFGRSSGGAEVGVDARWVPMLELLVRDNFFPDCMHGRSEITCRVSDLCFATLCMSYLRFCRRGLVVYTRLRYAFAGVCCALVAAALWEILLSCGNPSEVLFGRCRRVRACWMFIVRRS